MTATSARSGMAPVMASRPGMTRGIVQHVRGATAPKLLILFFITLPLLFSDRIVGMRISPVRLYLLLAFIPSVLALIRGRAGRILAADLFMALFALWIVITFVVDDGMEHFVYGSMVAIETLGSYLLGRVLIRNAEDYRLMIRIYLWVLIALLPFAFYELVTGRILLHEFYAHFGETVWRASSSHPRWGLQRVMSGFDHPILYGLFCSMFASSIFYIYKHARGSAVVRLALIGGMTFMSLSSGPLLSLVIQVGLVFWDRITKGRWIPLIVLAVSVYVALSLLSHRGPIVILISYATFNPWTAWTRISQWDWGLVAALKYPVFGLGLGQKWETVMYLKPWWLTSSIDSYWLVIAMRHGLVGVALAGVSFVLLLYDVIRARLSSALLRDYRTGYVIGVVGLCFVLFTVHIWGAVNDFAFFFLGAGAWLVEAGNVSGSSEEEAMLPAGTAPRGDGWAMTRFAQDHVRPGRRSNPSAPTPDGTSAAGEDSRGTAPSPLRRRRGPGTGPGQGEGK